LAAALTIEFFLLRPSKILKIFSCGAERDLMEEEGFVSGFEKFTKQTNPWCPWTSKCSKLSPAAQEMDEIEVFMASKLPRIRNYRIRP